LGFSRINYQNKPLEVAISYDLSRIAKKHGLLLPDEFAKDKLQTLISTLAEKYGRVVLLIDEYDKPIIDYLGHNIERAEQHRTILKTLYSVIKDSDAYIEFLMITGVSKFSKVSIFSELNNLTDITFHPRYANLTGISQQELEQYFASKIEELAEKKDTTPQDLLQKIRHWYNGYSWDGQHFVYNPYSLLSYFDFGLFKNFWFETGTPSFLTAIMKAQGMVQVSALETDSSVFSTYNIKKLETIPLLFQTGYLSIKEQYEDDIYLLDYPNFEVRESMLRSLISELSNEERSFGKPMIFQIRKALQQKELEKLIRLIKSIFKNIPYPIFKAKGEFYYHSLIYLVFFYLGDFMESEVNTNDGRLDAVIKTTHYIYVLEFKLDKNATTALQQIKDKGYAEKYYADTREKILLGINFSSELKTVNEWTYEELV
jgi:hypothetical protein